MPRSTRRTVEKNIYSDNHGFAIVVTYKGRRKEARAPKGTSLKKLRKKRDEILHALKQKSPAGGTFRGDAQAFLQSIPEGHAKDNKTYELKPWYAFIGALPRKDITPALIATAVDAMKGVAPSTIRKRLTAIKDVWRFHDGVHAHTPADHVKRPKETHEIRAIPRGVVTMILRKFPKGKTRARLKVLARTGLPHTQIAQLKPHHLDLDKREITVTPRRKGKGVPARTLPITHTAVRAFKEFQRANAWGTFSRHSMRSMFRTAVQAAKDSWKGRWPAADKLRPYDLRHTFLTEVYRQSRDLRATAELGLHADLSMTARYAAAAVSATAQAARDALEGATRSAKIQHHTHTVRARKSTSGSGKNVALHRGKHATTGRK